MWKRQRDDARRQRDRHAESLRQLRRGNLIFHPRELLIESQCPTCEVEWSHACNYPYSTSTLFSRLMVLWCPRCGLGWVPDVPFDLGEYYALEYAKSNRGDRDVPPSVYFSDENPLLKGKTGQRYFRRARAQVKRIRERIGSIDTMLDFGSGPGYALHSSGARVMHAVEADPSCAKYLDYLGAKRLSLEELPESFYDAVLCSHSIEHLTADDLIDTLRRLRRALKPEGLLYIEVPAAGLSRYHMVYKHEPHTLFFSPDAIRAAVAKVGFDVELARPLGKKSSPLLQQPLFEPADGDDDGKLSRGELTVIARHGTADVALSTPRRSVPARAVIAVPATEVKPPRRPATTDADRDERARLFDVNGFSVFRGLLSADEAATAAAQLRQEVGPERLGKSICDALNRLPSAGMYVSDPRVLDAVETILRVPPRLVQVTDVQTDHNRDNWHRDSACRTFGKGDWDESVHPYRLVKIILYLDIDRAGLGVVPGSHRIRTKLGKVEDDLTKWDLVDADDDALRPLHDGTPKRPALVEMRPGDALVFDERILHAGRRLTGDRTQIGDDFVGSKTTLAYVFGAENRHSWRFYSFFRFRRPELRYRDLAPDMLERLRSANLLPGFYGRNLFEEHPEELANITSK
ncbi:MAG: methyltransferase domain-containing protein [Deltaproteobacteria bacterium]|nr:methyltransferase domain-containing protein [Deltaproteobacteria bacterium]